MSSKKTLLINAALLMEAICLGLPRDAQAQNVQHLSITQPGGMPGAPVVTGVAVTSTNVTVTWDGPSGYYQLFESPNDLKHWQALGKATNLVRHASVPLSFSNAFFKVAGPATHYAGDHAVPGKATQVCLSCHTGINRTVTNTPHFHALEKFGTQSTNYPVASLSVGYLLPTGFTSQTATPQLADVQCENCHGPAANHAANELDSTVRPRVELAATVCGGCHNGPQHPIFEEWSTSAHATVTPTVARLMRGNTNFINECGRCHSGSARLSLLKKERLPVGDQELAVVCGGCHDPHAVHGFTNVLNGDVFVTNALSGRSFIFTNNGLGAVYTNQVRNPQNSTNDYNISPSAPFLGQYNSNIIICAQCHNRRGAVYTDSSMPPHHSLQYNMLLGNVGEEVDGIRPDFPAEHSRIEKQCVACHMQTSPFLSPAQPAVSGHSFSVTSFNVCVPCHGPFAQGLSELVQGIVSNQVQVVKADLDLWALTRAPATLTNFGALAWEYTSPGDLSSGRAGPGAALQSLIATNIQKARFNLYLVHFDGSLGIHNPFFALNLLDNADAFVQQELTNGVAGSVRPASRPASMQQLIGLKP